MKSEFYLGPRGFRPVLSFFRSNQIDPRGGNHELLCDQGNGIIASLIEIMICKLIFNVLKSNKGAFA